MDIKTGFGIKDGKGRELGARAWVHREGDRLRVIVHAARDGEAFGAYPGDVCVDSEEEARAVIERKVDAMRKRVTKAAAKTGGVYLTGAEKRAGSRAAPREAGGDAECTVCGRMYFSGDGRKTLPICAACNE